MHGSAGRTAGWALVGILGAALLAVPAAGGDKSSWLDLSSDQERQVMAFAGDYAAFMARARSELTATTEAVRLARQAGFRPFTPGERLRPGDRVFDVNRDRGVVFAVIGEHPIAEGTRIVASHIDSPRLELKGHPVYESEGFALFQTNYHGGIKTYQWTNVPLALIGRVDKKDGTTLEISVGLDPGDPVFLIPELSPHVSASLRDRSARDAIAYEELDPLAGHRPVDAEHGAKDRVMEYLKNEYGIEPEDLVSAELALVPADPPRDVGFDRALTAIYGQDDRLSAYASLRGLFEVHHPPFTSLVHLADNEESGNGNNTGASSSYLADLIGRLLYAQVGDAYRQPVLTEALRASRAVSIDVNPGVNPIWPGAWEKTNAPRLGHGVNLKLYGRGFNANSEYIAWFRNLLDEAQVPWQTTTYKVGRGGGGTLGGEMSKHNVDVIDIGVPVLSIHTPYSISSKADVYWLYEACAAFFARA